MKQNNINGFSLKAMEALGFFYVYALIDPRNEKVFYIGKGTGNRVFQHEQESAKQHGSEKEKIKKIQEIQASGRQVKRLIIYWGLSEQEAFIAEASLINLLNYMPEVKLTNIVAGHHLHESLTAEDFEHKYGAEPLEKEDIKHSIMVVKINKRYNKCKTDEELYDAVRGVWVASLKTIKNINKVEYVFGVYNNLIVAVYRPDEWHKVSDNKSNLPTLTPEELVRYQNRVYFSCKDFSRLDADGKFYLHRSIAHLGVNQSAQNPISYL